MWVLGLSGFQLWMSTSTALISVAGALMLGGYAQAICANIPEPAARSWTQVSGSGKYWTNKDFGGHSGRLRGQHSFGCDPGSTRYKELTRSSLKFFDGLDTQKVVEACNCVYIEQVSCFHQGNVLHNCTARQLSGLRFFWFVKAFMWSGDVRGLARVWLCSTDVSGSPWGASASSYTQSS